MKISISVIAIVVGLVALVVTLFSYFLLRRDFNDIKRLIKRRKQQPNLMCNVGDSNTSTRDDIINLQNKITDLESQLKDVLKSVSKLASTVSKISTKSAVVVPMQNHLYAKLNSDNYFTEVKSSKEETCVFDITLKSETEGEFEIISLDKIKQRDRWDSVVEYTGNCTITDAQRFVVNHKGRCIKLPNEMWMVVEKLKITLSK